MTQDSPTETTERALLFVMMDMPAEHDEEFNRWYAEEHLPERANLPGFGTARRFKAVAGEPPYLATYDLDSLAALETPEYKALVSPPGEWTRRIGRLLNANIRNVYTDQTPAHLPAGGHPDTAALLAVMLNVAPEHDAEVIDWYDNEHLPERLACPGFLSARRFSAVAGTNPRHLALYELTSTGALETPEYQQVSGNPTGATRRVLSLRQEGGKRTVYERIA
jgi:hypothetical protein